MLVAALIFEYIGLFSLLGYVETFHLEPVVHQLFLFLE